MKKAYEATLKGILAYINNPIVSSDIVVYAHISIFNSLWTKVIEDELFILSWYDYEWGFSNRMAELIVKKL